MSKAFETNVTSITLRNSSTTTVAAYKFVRMSTTTETDFDLITTSDTHLPIGITQYAINPSAVGAIGVSGLSRVKVSGTAWTTIYRTTVIGVGSNASGSALRMTASTDTYRAVGIHTVAASDIAFVLLRPPTRFGY